MLRTKVNRLLLGCIISAVVLHAQDLPACLDCHDSAAWLPLSNTPLFDHGSDTGFPLLLKHADLDCRACHLGDTTDDLHLFRAAGEECAACHQDPHQNYWGSNCEDCHSSEAWEISMAFRRHESTLFPLIGAHFSTNCYLCHTEPRQIPPTACQACHAPDFDPGLPSHGGLDMNTDCSTCHGPTRWNQILAINHDVFFPIYSGNHRGEWDSCSNCHTNAADYQTFTCMGSGCHSQSEMNSEHCEDGECERCNGLTYPSNGVDSNDCYSCHPRGDESTCGD